MWDNILNGAASLLYLLEQVVGDWGLAIIIVTLVIRLLLFPLQRKQYKSSFRMQEMQPKMQRIQELYANDQQKMQEETMKLYQETGFNPLSGCLPILIQMPIFVILFQTLRFKLVDYANVGDGVSFYNILPDLTITVEGSGFNLVYLLFAVLFVVFSVSPMILQLFMNKNTTAQQRSTNMMMLVIMGVMFVWMAAISPAGVILYWTLSSAFGFFQQLITNRVLKRERAEEEAAKPQVVEVNVQRKEKKKRPHKSR